MRRAIEAHLGSEQVSSVIYGAIIGLALVVALEHQPPAPGVMVGTLLATAVAVGLAELYSEVVGMEARTHRRVGRAAVLRMLDDVGAVALGIAFPCVRFWAGRLTGAGVAASLLQAIVVGMIGGALIAIKALIH